MRCCTLAVATLLGAMLAAGATHAHAADASATASLWHWSLQPWLIALLLGSAGLYAHGIRRLWRSAGVGRGIGRAPVVAFGLGWLALLLTLVSPLDALGGRLFSVHVVQHTLLTVVAAPLLVMGRPVAAWSWAFERPVRQALGRTAQTALVRGPWRFFTDPMVAWGVQAAVLWTWHVPDVFTAALEDEGLHLAQHAMFLAGALCFWGAMLGQDRNRPHRTALAVVLLFTTLLHTVALGGLLGLAVTPWYGLYIPTTEALGIDPVADQKLGALVLWLPSGVAYLVASLVLLGRLLMRQERARAR